MYLIKVSNDIQELTGYGKEILLDQSGEAIAIFWFGKMVTDISSIPETMPKLKASKEFSEADTLIAA